jgi:hypothetical protein
MKYLTVMSAVEIICDILIVALLACSGIFAYRSGYQKRALEDKKLIEDALVAQFRAEHAADVHRRRALALLTQEKQ